MATYLNKYVLHFLPQLETPLKSHFLVKSKQKINFKIFKLKNLEKRKVFQEHFLSDFLVALSPETLYHRSAVTMEGNEIFGYISNNDFDNVQKILSEHKLRGDLYDDHGMTPLQHAAYKGNKQICQLLLDHVSSSVRVQIPPMTEKLSL